MLKNNSKHEKRVGIERAAAFRFLSDSGLQRRRFFHTHQGDQAQLHGVSSWAGGSAFWRQGCFPEGWTN